MVLLRPAFWLYLRTDLLCPVFRVMQRKRYLMLSYVPRVSYVRVTGMIPHASLQDVLATHM